MLKKKNEKKNTNIMCILSLPVYNEVVLTRRIRHIFTIFRLFVHDWKILISKSKKKNCE